MTIRSMLQGGLRGVSLQIRLVLVSTLAIALTLLAAHALLTQLFERHVTDQFRSSLTTTLNQLTAGIRVDPSSTQPVLREPAGEPRWSTPYSGLYWQINAAPTTEGGDEQRSRSLWDFSLALPNDQLSMGAIHFHRVAGPNRQALIVAERLVNLGQEGNNQAFRLLVGADTHELGVAIGAFRESVTQYLVILALVLFAVLFLQVAVGLAPLRHITRALRRLRRGDVDALEGRFPSEVQPLADDFNTILSDHQRTVERARTFAGNLAHAIRTPLAILTNAADDQTLGIAELRRLITQQGSMAQAQIQWHLKRARMAASTIGHRAVRVKTVTDEILRVMRLTFADRQLSFEITVNPPDLKFQGEQQDLQEMLGNLIENACKWARSRVVITGSRDEGRLVITIEDDGMGVPESSHASILRRGVRMDELVPGSGLGLSIVAELVELYAGHISLAPSPFGGLQVRLDLPLHHAPPVA